MSRKEYFAYGSNLNFEQMAYRCPEATVVGTAKLDGYELAFRRGYQMCIRDSICVGAASSLICTWIDFDCELPSESV